MASSPDLPQRPTIYDVARHAGVSKSLVSLVLQGSPRVSEPRRAAVLAAIAALGYRPSRAATTLASRHSKNVEVVIDDYRNLSFVGLLVGLRSEFAAHGYHLTVTETGRGAVDDQGSGGMLAANLDGLIIAAETDNALLAGWTGPTVIAGWRLGLPDGADLVSNDDEHGGRMAAEYLLGLGHRAIGHLTGTGGPAVHRREGFSARVASTGATLVVKGELGGTAEEDGFHAARQLLDQNPAITAVFAANDTMALGALAAIRMSGLTVPGDVSVIGYDNSPLARSRYLDITSIDDSSELVGAAAGRAMLARFADPGRPPERALIEPTLVVRSTTSGPPVR